MVTLVNRAKMTTATTGTGTLTLGSAADGFQAFNTAGVADGDSVRYVIEDDGGFEIGTGVFDITAGTLTRDPSESSIGGGLLTLTGEATVFVGATAEDIQQALYTSTTFTATGGQTSFTVSYTVGFVEVFLNGVKLIDTTDYTATSGTSVVLASGATVNDVVEVVAYATVSVADTYTQAQADALFATFTGTATLTNKTISGADNTLTVDGTNAVGFRTIPQNSQSDAYTLVAADSGKHILHPSADTTTRTFTIPANSIAPLPVGTAITFINQNGAGVVTIAITTDTMRLAGAGTTGSRTLAANGIATAIKIAATEWIISGTGLT